MKHKHLIMLLFAICASISTFSQPIIRSQKIIGSDYVDQLQAMCLTKDGGLILGGYSESDISGDKTENSRGVWDYWLVKLDSMGVIEWDKTIGGSSEDYLTCLQKTSDGGYIVGGYSKSNISGDKTTKRKGEEDYWIVKLDSMGNIQWDKDFGGSTTDDLYSIQQTKDGGYILGGTSYSNISGNKSENSRGGSDYWIIKLDNSGNIQCDKTIGANQQDNFSVLQQTNDEGYIVGGHSNSNKSGEKSENAKGEWDYWIIKLDNSGNIQWDKTIGGYNTDFLSALQVTIDDGYILGGYSNSAATGDKTEIYRGLYDYWIVKLNNQGSIQWDKTIGGIDWDRLYSVEQTSDTGYIISGYSGSNISGEKTEDNRGAWYDYWVVKLDKFHNIQWDKTVGGNDDDRLIITKELEKNHYILGGYSKSEISGDKTKSTKGDSDFWLVRLNYKPATDVLPTSNMDGLVIAGNKDFTTYPNPAKDILHVQTTGKATVTLTDQSGKILVTKTISNKGEINVSHLPAGLYYVKNTTTGEVQKIVITK